MAIGLKKDCGSSGDYYKLGNKCYYYIETTRENTDYTGERIPNRFRLESATLIEIPSGKTFEKKPLNKKICHPSLIFPSYHYSENNFYSDSNCKNLVNCLPYKSVEGLYFNYHIKKFYWDNKCLQSISYEKK